MPYGIVDKKETGIGATTRELNSLRNSIIVTPTKSLAASKCKSHNLEPENENFQAIYVGSKITGYKELRPKDIIKYLQSEQKYKKILVVADSLPKVLDAIGKENYDKYFLMIDEADALQSDSTYRPNLENALDYYFEFNPKNRCLVSATIREFSHPKLKNEAFLSIGYESGTKRDATLIHSNSVNIVTKNEIAKRFYKTKDKIVIAYNSLTDIEQIIFLFSDEMKANCQIFCSEKSKENAGDYYAELVNGKLDKRITFMTCAYFVGVDINEKFHLISVSDNKLSLTYSMLSIEQLIQIAGRCRIDKGLLSNTIVFSTKEHEKVDLKQFFEEKLDTAKWYLNIHNSIKGNPNANKSNIKLICQRLVEVVEENGEKESLARNNIYNDYEIAWLKLDALTEHEYLKELYSDKYELQKQLLLRGWNVVLKTAYPKKKNKDFKKLIEAEEAIKDKRKISKMERIEGIIAVLKLSGFNESTFRTLIRNATRDTEQFISILHKLYKYTDKNFLIDKLKEILPNKNSSSMLDALNNKIIFKALDNNHHFKLDLINTFKINGRYSKEVIISEMKRIFNQHLSVIIDDNKAAIYLNQFFETKMGKDRKTGNYRTIKKLYPDEITAMPTSTIDKNCDLIKFLKLM